VFACNSSIFFDASALVRLSSNTLPSLRGTEFEDKNAADRSLVRLQSSNLPDPSPDFAWQIFGRLRSSNQNRSCRRNRTYGLALARETIAWHKSKPRPPLSAGTFPLCIKQCPR